MNCNIRLRFGDPHSISNLPTKYVKNNGMNINVVSISLHETKTLKIHNA